MGQERQHRRYSPSQAERFFACRGSTRLLATVPARPPSFYAQEGTDAHTVLEAALKNGVRDARDAHENYSTLFAEELDDGQNEFYFSVQVALDHIYSIVDGYSPPDVTMFVERFVCPPTDAAPGEAGGYCDAAILVRSTRTLYIVDYKHGAGVAKAVRGNRQAMQYAAGFLFEENTCVRDGEVDTVVLCIIQPRAFHEDGIIREHEVTPAELWDYLVELNEVIADCESGTATLTPGEEQCRFCDARTLCPAREAQALRVANETFSQIADVTAPKIPAPASLSLERLAAIRFHANTLRKFLSDVDDHCFELARAGHYIPGAKLVEVKPQRRYYGDAHETARRLAAMLGEPHADEAMQAYKDVMKKYPVLSKLWDHKLVPLTHAEKRVVEEYKRRVGRGRKNQAAAEARQSFAFLTLKQSSGKLTLVDEDDPRPAVNRAQNAFAQIAHIAPPEQETP